MLKTHFSLEFLEHATETLRAVGHPIRIAIIDLLHRYGELSVSQIHEHLEIDQAVASHHLRILKNKSVVDFKRDGKHSNYFLTRREYHQLIDLLTRVQ